VSTYRGEYAGSGLSATFQEWATKWHPKVALPFNGDYSTDYGDGGGGLLTPTTAPTFAGGYRDGQAIQTWTSEDSGPLDSTATVQSTAMLVYIPSTSVSAGLWSKGGATTGHYIYLSAGTLAASFRTSSLDRDQVTAPITAGWHTVGVSFSTTSGVMALYIDGLVVDSVTPSLNTANATGNPKIGDNDVSGVTTTINGTGILISHFAWDNSTQPSQFFYEHAFSVLNPPYEWGDYWIATGSGTINGQAFYPGAKIIAKGDPVGASWAVVNSLPAPSYQATSTPGVTIATSTPSSSIVAQFESDLVTVIRRVDIYEKDGTTLYLSDVAVETGSVSVDMGRAERRNIDLTLNDDRIEYGPGGFWYDKVIKAYRGILLNTGDAWLAPLGVFLPDNITRPRFPGNIQVTGRDFSKKLILDKFGATTTFAQGLVIADVIRAIATNGGITSFNFQSPTDVLTSPVTFEIGSERMQACVDLSQAINHEVYFDAYGAMVLRPFVDPLTAQVSYTFKTGVTGNLVDYGRTTTDTFMFNDVVVYGSATENKLVNGRATNTNDLSPTSINRVGRRTKTIPNQFVANDAAAISIAQSFLSVSGLEQYDLSIESLVIPWLEAGEAILAQLPDASLTDPDRFLLSSFSVPLALGSMSMSAKRVIIVG